MARARTGQLIKRASGFYARVWTVIDGEHVRVMRALGTQSRAAAKQKLNKLLASPDASTVDVHASETFREAAERVYAARIAEAETAAGGPVSNGPRVELSGLRRYAYEVIGDIAAGAVKPQEVNGVLDAGKAAGLSRQSVQHLRQRLSTVFAVLVRDGSIAINPVSAASMPKFAATVVRERAVLSDAELAVYLGWEHPIERFQAAVRERQTMSCMSRMFGGIRAGDLHALRWDAFDVEHGAFTWGYAPRAKTRRPQLLEVPAMLRPMLRDHWERAGRPAAGLLFPVRRVGSRGDRVGEQRIGVSHADAFRRDLQTAFKAAGDAEPKIDAPVEGSKRWAELFTETAYTRPVDFHSWRRAFAQALADADVNAQTAQALTGHADLAAHARYLRSSGRLRALPTAALPDLRMLPGIAADAESEAAQWALAKGSETVEAAESGRNASAAVLAKANSFGALRFAGLTPEPKV